MPHGGSRLVEGREGMPLGVITFHLDVDMCVCVRGWSLLQHLFTTGNTDDGHYSACCL